MSLYVQFGAKRLVQIVPPESLEELTWESDDKTVRRRGRGWMGRFAHENLSPKEWNMFFDLQLDIGFQQVLANMYQNQIHSTPVEYADTVELGTQRDPAQLSSFTNERLLRFGFLERRVDGRYADRQSTNGKFQLNAREWGLISSGTDSLLAVARSVSIRSSKNAILNTWIFPVNCLLTPVFAAELICIAGVHRVAFIDIQTPGLNPERREEVSAITSPLSTKYTVLPSDNEPPSWATADSTGNFSYARNAGPEWSSIVANCYQDYLSVYLSGVLSHDRSQSRSIVSTAESDAVLSAYQIHHMHSSPGKKFLDNLFTSDWTDDFMNGFLFTLPKE
ncbi:MAG: phytochromobilin:ferredoxin oxidoreductase [Pirellula sp.]|jgi:hypothetical protein|nr:phytochromobilin:ferredoxin oxidoreductase [Pirellula sp.]